MVSLLWSMPESWVAFAVASASMPWLMLTFWSASDWAVESKDRMLAPTAASIGAATLALAAMARSIGAAASMARSRSAFRSSSDTTLLVRKGGCSLGRQLVCAQRCLLHVAHVPLFSSPVPADTGRGGCYPGGLRTNLTGGSYERRVRTSGLTLRVRARRARAAVRSARQAGPGAVRVAGRGQDVPGRAPGPRAPRGRPDRRARADGRLPPRRRRARAAGPVRAQGGAGDLRRLGVRRAAGTAR